MKVIFFALFSYTWNYFKSRATLTYIINICSEKSEKSKYVRYVWILNVCYHNQNMPICFNDTHIVIQINVRYCRYCSSNCFFFCSSKYVYMFSITDSEVNPNCAQQCRDLIRGSSQFSSISISGSLSLFALGGVLSLRFFVNFARPDFLSFLRFGPVAHTLVIHFQARWPSP